MIETKSVECTGKGIGSNDELGEDVVEWFAPSVFLIATMAMGCL